MRVRKGEGGVFPRTPDLDMARAGVSQVLHNKLDSDLEIEKSATVFDASCFTRLT